MLLPAGKTYKSGLIELKSNVEMSVERGAILLASDRYEDFENPILREINRELDDERYIQTSERKMYGLEKYLDPRVIGGFSFVWLSQTNYYEMPLHSHLTRPDHTHFSLSS